MRPITQEPYAIALPLAGGGEERFEGVGQRILVHSGPGIGYRDKQIVSRRKTGMVSNTGIINTDNLNDYERKHLLEHLFASDLTEYIHTILGDFDGNSFCWAANRLLLDGNYSGYVVDLEYGRRCTDGSASFSCSLIFPI